MSEWTDHQPMTDTRLSTLCDALDEGGVVPTDDDRRVLYWLASFDAELVATLTRWIVKAHETGLAWTAYCDDGPGYGLGPLGRVALEREPWDGR